jgi:AraC-like DNA-binding protein
MTTLTLDHDRGSTAAASDQRLDELCRAVGAEAAILSTTTPSGGLKVCRRQHLPEPAERRYTANAAKDYISWQAIMTRVSVRDSQLEEPLVVGDGLAVVAAVRIESPIFVGFSGVVTFFNRIARGPLEIAPAILADAVATRIGSSTEASPRQFIFDETGRCLTTGNWAACFNGPAAAAAVEAEVRRRLQAEPIVDASAARFCTVDASDQIVPMQIVGPMMVPGISEKPVLFVSLHPNIEDWKRLSPNAFAGDPELHRLAASVAYMVEHFRQGPTLQTIAEAAHLSQFHFHRRFSELFGITPKALLYDLQLSEAKRLLADGRVDLVEIAKQCGFAHQSHFTSRFKQGTGVTPTRWRRTAAGPH